MKDICLSRSGEVTVIRVPSELVEVLRWAKPIAARRSFQIHCGQFRSELEFCAPHLGQIIKNLGEFEVEVWIKLRKFFGSLFDFPEAGESSVDIPNPLVR